MAFVIGVMGWCVFKNPEEKQRRKKLLECPKQKKIRLPEKAYTS